MNKITMIDKFVRKRKSKNTRAKIQKNHKKKLQETNNILQRECKSFTIGEVHKQYKLEQLV